MGGGRSFENARFADRSEVRSREWRYAEMHLLWLRNRIPFQRTSVWCSCCQKMLRLPRWREDSTSYVMRPARQPQVFCAGLGDKSPSRGGGNHHARVLLEIQQWRGALLREPQQADKLAKARNSFGNRVSRFCRHGRRIFCLQQKASKTVSISVGQGRASLRWRLACECMLRSLLTSLRIWDCIGSNPHDAHTAVCWCKLEGAPSAEEGEWGFAAGMRGQRCSFQRMPMAAQKVRCCNTAAMAW